MKKKTLNTITLSIFGINLLFLPLYLSSFSTTEEVPKPTNDSSYQRIVIPKIPTELRFCNEPVPLDREDVKQSLDRELLINTFWHSSTIQCLKRSKEAFKVIEPILAEHGVPEDFKYLAVIESSLTNATSPSGAKGVWQFMPATGPEYGLKINKEIDERLSLEKATHAACKYFIKAHDRFGSWTNVAASYNMGMHGVDRQLDGQFVESYYDLLLNSETARYVYRILAIKYIFENRELFGFCLDNDDYYSTVAFEEIQIVSTVADFKKFAVEKNTNYKLLKFLNPWLISDRLTIKNDTVYIRIPQ